MLFLCMNYMCLLVSFDCPCMYMQHSSKYDHCKIFYFSIVILIPFSESSWYVFHVNILIFCVPTFYFSVFLFISCIQILLCIWGLAQVVWSWGGDEGGKKLIICLHLPYSLVPCQTKTTTIVLVIKCIKFLLPLQPHMQQFI